MWIQEPGNSSEPFSKIKLKTRLISNIYNNHIIYTKFLDEIFIKFLFNLVKLFK
jgi:hypothetical protein